MKLLTKKTLTILSLCAVILVLLVQGSSANAATTTTAKDRAIDFIKNVIQPDLSKYTVTLASDIVGQTPIQPSTTLESVKYHLDSNGNGVDIICEFQNNALTGAELTTSGSTAVLSTDPSANLNDKVRSVLEGYQTYTGENLQDMTSTLTNVDITQNITKIAGNIKLTTENSPLMTSISLKYSFNGTDYTGVDFVFKDGQFYAFKDDRSLWTIGNTNVNLNMSQAIDIAKQYVQNYSYTLDNGLTVNGFNVTNIQAGLNTYPKDNSTTIYPYWSVQLNLGKLYPGNVWQLSVGIWADSGTVFFCQPIGFGGSLPTPDQTSTESTVTSTPIDQSAQQPQQTQVQGHAGIPQIDLGIIVVVLATIAALGTIIVKKRSK